MLIAFFILLILAMYKIYTLFNTAEGDVDVKTEHDELQDIIISFIQDNEISETSNEAFFKQLIERADFDRKKYKNFNLNRFNQLAQQLFYTYDVNSLAELIESINAQNR